MRHLKSFESFGMNVAFCERCEGPTKGQTTTSMFNLQTICMSCKDDEKKDPEYDAACQMENEEIRKGNYNYLGAIPNYKSITKANI
jgi:RecJ-like exonuclease